MEVTNMQFDETRKYYVYVWYYTKDEKVFYVGKGCKYRYRSRKRDNAVLVNIINTNDCDSKIIKGNLNEKEAFEFEKEMIAYYKENGHPLINVQDGGHMPPNAKGKKRSDETKIKMSDSMKAYYKNNPDVVKKQSERFKEFLKTDEGLEFERKSLEARRTDDFRKKQSEISKKVTGTDEYRSRQSEIVKNFWKSDKYKASHSGSNNGRAQAVRQYSLEHELIAEYSTMSEASIATGVKVTKISLVAKGKRKSSGGFIWEYVSEKIFNQSKSSRVYDPYNDKCAKPILQYDKSGNFIKEYISTAQAVEENGFANRTNITQNLKGKTKSAYGYVWKYKQDNIVPSL